MIRVELIGEALRRAEAIAGDYHPSREIVPPAEHSALFRAAGRLRRKAATGSAESWAPVACARLLEELARSLRRGEPLPTGLTTAAAAIVAHVLAPHPAEDAARSVVEEAPMMSSGDIAAAGEISDQMGPPDSVAAQPESSAHDRGAFPGAGGHA